MRNNKLILYKEDFFTRISNFFKRIFFRKQKSLAENIEEKDTYNNKSKEVFLKNIQIEQNEEEKRLKKLQLQYDNGEIDEDDISDDDADKLIELYKKETFELNADTEKRKNHIAKMLKELKGEG